MLLDPSLTFRTTKALHQHAAAVKDACLVYIYPSGPNMGTRYILKDDETLIGRTDECHIRNCDNSVSRNHARIELREDGFFVMDLGSTNGTFVNNAYRRESKLNDGDYVRIGNCIYRFLAGGNLEAEYHEEIYRLTVIDGLTGLHNRRYLLEYLDRELARAHRFGRTLSIAMFDIDHFKRINDKHGHLAGDMTLRELAGILKSVVRKDELLARYGGEEFVMVLPETTLQDAEAACNRLREAVTNHLFIYQSLPISVSISGGVALSTPDCEPEDLIRMADEKLYEAKRAGRNRIIC